MKSFNVLLLSCVFCFPMMAQQTATTTSKLKRKVGWLWSFGIGYRDSKMEDVNNSLFAGNNNKTFGNGYLTGSISLHAVFFDRLLLGLESEGMSILNTVKANNNHYLMGGNHVNLSLGYNVINNAKGRLSVYYGLGVDLNSLNIQRQNLDPIDFNTAVSTYSSNTLISINMMQRVSLRYDFITLIKETESRKLDGAWGIEAGYYFSGNNTWRDSNINDINGPAIKNDGLFVRALYSFNRTKKTTGDF